MEQQGMLRPAERFSVNIVRRDEYIGPQPSVFRLSPLTLVVLAAILGTGLGGVLPAAWGPASDRAGVTLARLASDPAYIEPAAGPAGGLAVPRAADRGFYAPVLLDSIAVTMRLAPDTTASSLAARDARLLAAPDLAAGPITIGRMRLGGVVAGPLTLPVSDADASVLGADLLEQFGTVRIDDRQLTLSAP
jgi:hypothetical protein